MSGLANHFQKHGRESHPIPAVPKSCHILCFCDPVRHHRLSLNHYQAKFSVRLNHGASAKGFPDKREVVSSILTRPILVNPFQVRRYKQFSSKHFQKSRLKTSHCTRIVSKKFHRLSSFELNLHRPSHLIPCPKITYRTPFRRQNRGTLHLNCTQKYSHIAFGRGFSS